MLNTSYFKCEAPSVCNISQLHGSYFTCSEKMDCSTNYLVVLYNNSSFSCNSSAVCANYTRVFDNQSVMCSPDVFCEKDYISLVGSTFSCIIPNCPKFV